MVMCMIVVIAALPGPDRLFAANIPVGMEMGGDDDALRSSEQFVKLVYVGFPERCHGTSFCRANLRIILHLINQFSNFVEILSINKSNIK